jgi:predicted SprT family Zn-dependent metalloprotease
VEVENANILDLKQIFGDLNLRFFEGFLDEPQLLWNSKLRSSAGRFVPGSRRFLKPEPPKIEVASYLLKETDAFLLIQDTLAHEMIHYWLWVRKRPYGHTSEFYEKMKVLGCSRYNSVPKLRPIRYFYECANCRKSFPAKKLLKSLACAECCKKFSAGRYDRRFKLSLSRRVSLDEGLELARQSLRARS